MARKTVGGLSVRDVTNHATGSSSSSEFGVMERGRRGREDGRGRSGSVKGLQEH